MKKIYLLSLLLILTCLSLFNVSAQTLTEGFEFGLPSSGASAATDYTLASGSWNILKGAGGSTAHSGSLGLKLSGGSTSAPTFAAAPPVNAVSTVSFWAKGSSNTIYTIQKSVNGGAYTDVATQAVTTTFTQYTININEAGSNVRIRFANKTSQTHYIDDVTITGGVVTPSPSITTSVSSLASFGNIVSGAVSASSSYTVSGSNLTSNITVTAPAGFAVSTNNSTFGSSVTLTQSGGAVATTTIYARFAPVSASGAVTGDITNTSTGASSKSVSLSGNSIAAEPTIQSAISFGTVTENSIVVNTAGGNGSNRIVVARSGSAVSYVPTDAVAPSGVNASFSSATDQGSGNKIVYSGSGTSVTVTGLSSGTTYYFAVYELNVGTNASQNYLTANPGIGNKTTTVVITPVITTSVSSLVSFGNIVSGSVSASSGYTVSGANLTANLTVTAPSGFTVSTDNSVFSSSVTLTQSGGTVATTNIYARFAPASAAGAVSGNITNASAGATSKTVSVSGVSIAAQPTVQSAITFGTVTDNSIVVNTSGGNGGNRIIVVRSGSAVSYVPTDAVAPSGVNASFSSATDQGSGNKIVYSGTGSSVTVTGLSSGTTYYFAVYEYNVGTNASQNYLTTNPGTGNKATTSTVAQTLTIAFSAANAPYLVPQYVSGVKSDPTDPAGSTGVLVDVKGNGVALSAASYTITATSSKTSVVPVANIVVTKLDGQAAVKITPTGTGYSDIKLTLAKTGSTSVSLTIKYAASAASSTPASTYWHTGISDASAAIALDDNYMVIGDDELNNLYVFNRNHSGLPVKTYSYGSLLSLPDGSSKEIDLEACVRSVNFPNRVYWISSLGEGNSKPNINQIFATTVTGTGAATAFAYVGKYNSIRSKLIAWGDSKGYNLTSSGTKDPKTIDGFNIEGMTMGPDNTTLYIGFRAPLVPTSSRQKALIAPLLNFETWFNNGSPSGNPTFGNPIELNLGGRGIRDIVRLSNGTYVIIGGNYAASPLTEALFTWTGNAGDAPVQISSMNIASLNAEALVEIKEGGQLATNKLQIITDNGSTDFYADGTEAKSLSQANYKKFRSDIITGSAGVLGAQGLQSISARKAEKPLLFYAKNETVSIYPNPAKDGKFTVSANAADKKELKISDIRGTVYKTIELEGSSVNINTSGWAKGYYIVSVYGNNGIIKTERLLVQ